MSLKANTVTTVEQRNGAEVGTGAEECAPGSHDRDRSRSKGSIIDTGNRSTGEEAGRGSRERRATPGRSRSKDRRRRRRDSRSSEREESQSRNKENTETKKVEVHTEKRI